MADSREKLFLVILVFFAIITAITGAVNLINSGVITLGDFGSADYMQTIPGQVSPPIGGVGGTPGTTYATYGRQDYTSSSGFAPNITKISTSVVSGDTFTRSDGVGYSSSYIPLTSPLAYLSVVGASPTGTVYNIKYRVYNQFQSFPFYILISGSDVGSNQISGFFAKFDSNGIHAVHTTNLNNHLSTINYPYASGSQDIETRFDYTTNTVEILINGASVGTLTNLNYGGVTPQSGAFNAGVAASHSMLQVSSIDGTFIGEIPNSVDLLSGLLTFATQLLSMVTIFFGLTSNPLVPFWLWAIIGIPCVATLYLIYVEIARGV